MSLGRREFITTAGLAGIAGMAHASVIKRLLPPVDLDFISDEMTICRRSEWTSSAVKTLRMRGIGNVDRVSIHHAGGGIDVQEDRADIVAALRGVLSDHTQRGYGDIGYHMIIDYTGRVWEGRSLAYEGAHIQDQNERNIGIMLLGNFDIQEPSEKQLSSMKQLVGLFREHYRIKRHRIYGHRDLGASACPGENLYVYVQKMKDAEL